MINNFTKFNYIIIKLYINIKINRGKQIISVPHIYNTQKYY